MSWRVISAALAIGCVTLLLTGWARKDIANESEKQTDREASYPMEYRPEAPYQFSGLESTP